VNCPWARARDTESFFYVFRHVHLSILSGPIYFRNDQSFDSSRAFSVLAKGPTLGSANIEMWPPGTS